MIVGTKTEKELKEFYSETVTLEQLERAWDCMCSGMCRAADHDLGNNIERRKKLHDAGCPKLKLLELYEALCIAR